jgi:hypothetical protein
MISDENDRYLDAIRAYHEATRHCEAFAEAARAFQYARNEGGVSMVDWFAVAWRKTEAALAAWEKSKGGAS